MKEVMCRRKFLDFCPECKRDMDINHHPNNYDCPRFKSITIFISETKEKNDQEKKKD